MFLCETILRQIDAVRLPVFAVTLTALPRANTPLLLMLHWHGYRRDPTDKNRQHCAVPSSALQVSEAWHTLPSLDAAMLDAAWRLGAWELDRQESRACNTAGATAREAMECRQAFGVSVLGTQAVVAEAPDRAEMFHAGTRVGYIRWQFRPVRGGIWRETAVDATLSTEGERQPPCPVAPQPLAGKGGHRTRYRLGRIDRIAIV